ncbi:MAG: biopolymer transporter ExbD [Rhodoferax sp.]|uniref:ExbD/TolR family protein n=1 Tax=Rhodoferax sp. TaxID=50421 RepID=UPI001B491FDD|nr:biopolymer transporter ExbD [Rhodoferax sp.]MBP9150623.1 biopolymer transporter ExbD [Rhodoferax sp.]MBP9735607.1 biopolymer transporter ExbD [Rhodoferax sp.]
MAIDYADHADLENLDLSAGINITPLIDVLLVLLVMLIITIPIQLHAVNMELPAGAPPMQTAQPLVVRLDVGADNQIAWDGQPLADRAMLYARLQAAAAWPVPPEIHVRAHANAKYDTVAAVLSAAQRMGLEKIGVVGLEAYAR